MKIYSLILLFAMMVPQAVGQQTAGAPQQDPYDIAFVKSMIEQQKQAVVVSLGFEEKYIYRSGDRMSISILKIFSEEELIEPSNVKAYLPLIREAFEFPKLIEHEADREPKVTLFLLHFVEKNVKDGEMRKEVGRVTAELGKVTAAPTK
jgi:hypothetical protein